MEVSYGSLMLKTPVEDSGMYMNGILLLVSPTEVSSGSLLWKSLVEDFGVVSVNYIVLKWYSLIHCPIFHQ